MKIGWILPLALVLGLISTGAVADRLLVHSNDGPFDKRQDGPANAGTGDLTGGPLSAVAPACSFCHAAGAFGTVTPTLTVGANGVEYLAGATHPVTIDIAFTSGSPTTFGFQIVALDDSNTSVGTWTAISANTGVTNFGGADYWEHRNDNASTSVSAQWTAPSAGAGDVTFYYAAVAGNDDATINNDSGSTAFSSTYGEGLPVQLKGFRID